MRTCASIVAVALAVLVGCEAREEPVTIDERVGEYRSVRFGSSEREVIRVFGEPNRESGFAPVGRSPAEIGVPQSIKTPGGPPLLLKYEHVAFLITPGTGVYAMIVTEAGTTTTRGVAIGDKMEDARRRYSLRCLDVAGGESLLDGQEFYSSCGANIGRARIWFGRDPIKSITLVLRNVGRV
jgi:hypothetical protein